jgi:hypothetical protein
MVDRRAGGSAGRATFCPTEKASGGDLSARRPRVPSRIPLADARGSEALILNVAESQRGFSVVGLGYFVTGRSFRNGGVVANIGDVRLSSIV